MKLRQMLVSLRAQGFTDEQISAELGKLLGGTGPSARSVARWRRGKVTPYRLYRQAVIRLHNKKGQPR